jgi:hypothetical protein
VGRAGEWFWFVYLSIHRPMAAVVYSGDLELLSSDILALRCGRCLFWRRMNGEVAAGELFFFFLYIEAM